MVAKIANFQKRNEHKAEIFRLSYLNIIGPMYIDIYCVIICLYENHCIARANKRNPFSFHEIPKPSARYMI